MRKRITAVQKSGKAADSTMNAMELINANRRETEEKYKKQFARIDRDFEKSLIKGFRKLNKMVGMDLIDFQEEVVFILKNDVLYNKLRQECSSKKNLVVCNDLLAESHKRLEKDRKSLEETKKLCGVG